VLFRRYPRTQTDTHTEVLSTILWIPFTGARAK